MAQITSFKRDHMCVLDSTWKHNTYTCFPKCFTSAVSSWQDNRCRFKEKHSLSVLQMLLKAFPFKTFLRLQATTLRIQACDWLVSSQRRWSPGCCSSHLHHSELLLAMNNENNFNFFSFKLYFRIFDVFHSLTFS